MKNIGFGPKALVDETEIRFILFTAIGTLTQKKSRNRRPRLHRVVARHLHAAGEDAMMFGTFSHNADSIC